MKREYHGRKLAWYILKHYPRIHKEGQRKIRMPVSEGYWTPGQKLNTESPDNKVVVLTA
jgi:hypothetical protein